MLERLRLQNFALFVDQSVEFDNGVNSLLGETGAGKSIIIDALSFVIGAKSDKIVIRYGENSRRYSQNFLKMPKIFWLRRELNLMIQLSFRDH